MSLLSGLFTSPGQSQQLAQGKRNSGIASDYSGLFGQLAPQYGSLLTTEDHYNLGHAIGSALNGLNQDPSQRIGQYGAGATEAASNNAAQQANYLKSQGYGDGAVGGAGAGLYQQAAAQTNAYAAQQYSPQTQQEYLNALLQSISGANGVYSNALGGLAQGAYGQPQVQAGSSPLGGILSGFLGGFSSQLGKKAA